MRFWLAMFGVPVSGMATLAGQLETAGYEGVAIPDHACIPERIDSPYPYGKPADKSQGLTSESDFPDPWVCIANMAAATTKLRFATHVTVVPLLHPFTLYRLAATAAAASNNRVDMGIGLGWMAEEFEAMGLDFRTRASRTDESLAIIKELMKGRPLAWEGKHFTFEAVTVTPKLETPIPIIAGGESPAALRRAARFADGWVGAKASPAELTELVKQLRIELEAAGRDFESFTIRTRLKEAPSVSDCEELAAIGVDAVLIPDWLVEGATVAERVERFSTDVISQFPRI
jgi:probable F420-dependent oxidoreductase